MFDHPVKMQQSSAARRIDYCTVDAGAIKLDRNYCRGSLRFGSHEIKHIDNKRETMRTQCCLQIEF